VDSVCAQASAELYTYNFIVDGLTVNDVNNVFLQRDGTRYLSVLLVPGDLTANYFEAGKRGNLRKIWYSSPTIGTTRRMYVYTPMAMKPAQRAFRYYTFFMAEEETKMHGSQWGVHARSSTI